jgi:hypothetical protein
VKAGKQPLYQVQVSTATKEQIFVGPAVSEPGVLEPFVETINKAVALGKERDWRDAHIVQITPGSTQ